MLTDNGILARRINYGCCALSYMHAYEVAETYGDTDCAEKNYRLALYMMWAQSVANRTPTSAELLVDAVVVEGAGTEEANGLYLPNGTVSGRPQYSKAGAFPTPPSNARSIFWDSGTWLIYGDAELELYASASTANSPLGLTWSAGSDGVEPAPTVRQATVADLCAAGIRCADKCFDRTLAEQIFKSADCFCSPCGCGEPPDSIPFPPPEDPCAAVPTGAALAAVDVADRVAIEAGPPAVGDTYYVVSFTGGSGWSLNTLQTWNGTGWDAEAVAIGSIIEVGGGELWTYLGLGLPGLLYPTVTMTWVGGTPEQYVLQSDYPQVALFTGRTAMVQLLTPGGWQTVFQGPEADLAVPIPFDATGFTFTAVTVTYTLGSCAWTASTGSIEPDGCVFPGAHSCSSHDIDSHF